MSTAPLPPLPYAPTHAVIRECVLHLASTVECTDERCHAHAPLRGSMRLLHALWEAADRRLDAAPPSLRTGYDVESWLVNSIPGWREAVVLAYQMLDRPLDPLHRVGSDVRSTHPESFMRDEWGTIHGLIMGGVTGDVCWAIRWDDGASDVWLPSDPNGMYEFREVWQR